MILLKVYVKDGTAFMTRGNLRISFNQTDIYSIR